MSETPAAFIGHRAGQRWFVPAQRRLAFRRLGGRNMRLPATEEQVEAARSSYGLFRITALTLIDAQVRRQRELSEAEQGASASPPSSPDQLSLTASQDLPPSRTAHPEAAGDPPPKRKRGRPRKRVV